MGYRCSADGAGEAALEPLCRASLAHLVGALKVDSNYYVVADRAFHGVGWGGADHLQLKNIHNFLTGGVLKKLINGCSTSSTGS